MLIIVLEEHHFNNITNKYCTNNTYSLFYYVFVKHYTGRQEFFGEIQGEISKTKRELYRQGDRKQEFEGGVTEVSSWGEDFKEGVE